MFSKTIWNGQTDVAVSLGQQYIIEGYVYLYDDPVNLPFLDLLTYKPVGYSLAELESYTSLDKTSTPDSWHKISTVFTTKDANPINIGLYQEYSNEGTNTTGNCDNVTLKGPLDLLTEKKTIIYDQGCLFKDFEVKYLDALGGYSYWTFRTYADEGVDFQESRTIKRNIFSDFPNTFKSTQVQTDYLSVESKDTITLRAENLSFEQYKSLLELLRSVRVYDVNGDTPKVLIIDKNSISQTQGEKLYNVSFNATYTFDNYRQRQ